LFEIGGSLAAARKGQGLTLSDAERLTCMRARYLAALEADRFDLLPGRVYARAFLRTYADALGLDADRFVEEFDERYPREEELPPAPPLVRPRRPNRLRRALVAAAVGAAVVGAVVWSTASSPPPPPPPSPLSAAAGAERPPKPHGVLGVTHAAPVPRRRFPLVVSADGGRCWLQARRGGPNGPVLWEGTLEQGQSVRFAPRVWLRLGAPWAVTLRRGPHVHARLPARAPLDLVA